MARLFISSSSNARLKALRRLVRQGSSSVCVAEGQRAVSAALASGVPVRELFTAPRLLGEPARAVVAEAERQGVHISEVEASTFATLTPHRQPDGLIATLDRPASLLTDIVLPPRPLVLVTVGIARPGNLGTIIRTACACAADALIAADPCTDLYHRDVIRGSLGSIFQLTAATATTAEVIGWLRRHGLEIVATSPRGEAPYWQLDPSRPLALVVGSERHGLPAQWLDTADRRIAIPMPGAGDSLNAAVAAGIVLAEATRRRLNT